MPPTVDEVQKIREALGERRLAVVVTLAGSGLRIGELLGLNVSDVDFSAELSASSGNARSPVSSPQ